MDAVSVIVKEPHDGKNPGQQYVVTERRAAQLVARGLVKMAAPPLNKMAKPHANKANPSPAAGEAQPSSASQAAPVSLLTTASVSLPGAPVTPSRGRSTSTTPQRRPRGASSP